MKTLNDLLDRAASEGPSRIALITETETITYSQLRERVLLTAAGFKAHEVKRGDFVAIIHRNDPAFVIAYFALMRLGAVAVPINYMVQKPQELSYMLNDCSAVQIVTQKEYLKGIRASDAPKVKHIWVTDASSQECEGLERPFSEIAGDPAILDASMLPGEDDLATILYTSGTTGHPKGAMLTHKNLVSDCESARTCLDVRSSDVFLAILPMFHSFCWTAEILISMSLKAKVVICPSITPPTPWLKLMAKHRVTIFAAVPPVYSVLVRQATGFKGLVLKYWFFRKVRIAVSGASPLTPVVQEGFEKTFGLRIMEGYGLSETAPVSTVNSPHAYKRTSVGRAIPGVTLKVIDDQGKELAAGQEGEICIKGPNVTTGYLNLPEATKESFTPDGYFKSGDVGIVDDDGFLFIRDRKKDMINVKGLKVFSAQVEAVLLEHPDIEEAAVIGIPHDTGDETIKAFIVLKKDAKADKNDLMAFCRQKFDAYKRPRDIEIVKSLPKNALQKVLKRELRKQEIEKLAANDQSKD
jgi:long-chain acyl-CoA synthetase